MGDALRSQTTEHLRRRTTHQDESLLSSDISLGEFFDQFESQDQFQDEDLTEDSQQVPMRVQRENLQLNADVTQGTIVRVTEATQHQIAENAQQAPENNATKKEKNLRREQAALQARRNEGLDMSNTEALQFLNNSLRLTEMDRSKNLKAREITEDEKKRINYEADQRIVQLYQTTLSERNFPPDQKKKLHKALEKASVKLIHSKCMYKNTQIADRALQDQEVSREKRHRFYDFFLQPLMSISNGSKFGKAFDYGETCTIEGRQGALEVKNKGRQTMGGTKPMYLLSDGNGNDYLLKKGITAGGTLAPDRCHITEAASKLQHRLCPDNYIHAGVLTNSSGEVVGNYQEFIKGKEESEAHTPPQDGDYLKLKDWQANMESSGPDDIDGGSPIPAQAAKEVMQSHVMDWILCNYDTKGENFLQKPDGHYVAIDKEASFKFIDKPEAQTMSTTYKPHSDNTIYNVMYGKYAEGKLKVKLDFECLNETLSNLMSMSDEEYKGMFAEYALSKKKCKTPNDKSNAFLDKINQRRLDVINQYEIFFGDLITKRYRVLESRNSLDRDPDIRRLMDYVNQNGGRYKLNINPANGGVQA